MTIKRYTSLVAALAAVALALTGCAAGSGASGSGKKLSVVALLPTENDSPYGTSYTAAMKKQAEKLGIQLKIDNSVYNASTQASQCNIAVAQHPSGIILWPGVASAVRPCLLKAKAAGIPVNASNSNVLASDQSLIHSYSGPSNAEVGRLDADLLGKALHGKGGIVIVQGQPGNSTATDRQSAFESELKSKYPGITILGAQPANWQKSLAITATSELLTRYGKQIKGIYAQDDTTAAGSIVALQNDGIDPSTIPIVGCGNTTLGQPNVLSGKQYGTLFQSPVWDAQHAINGIDDVINGKKIAKTIYMPMPEVTKANASKYPPQW